MLSNFYTDAVCFALEAHRQQIRKNGTPYAAHLLAVSSLVLEAGGTEKEAISALFHDLLEDIWGGKFPDQCLNRKGEFIIPCNDPYVPSDWVVDGDILRIMKALSEDKSLPKADRKAQYIIGVSDLSNPLHKSIALVSAADKLHNLRSYYHDFCTYGTLIDAEAKRFNKHLVDVYAVAESVPSHWVNEMNRILEQLLDEYNLLELEEVRFDLKTCEKQIDDRENEIRRECGDIISLLDNLIREHETLNDDGTPSLTGEQVRERAAPLIKRLESFAHNWKRRFSPEERFFLTGEE